MQQVHKSYQVFQVQFQALIFPESFVSTVGFTVAALVTVEPYYNKTDGTHEKFYGKMCPKTPKSKKKRACIIYELPTV